MEKKFYWLCLVNSVFWGVVIFFTKLVKPRKELLFSEQNLSERSEIIYQRQKKPDEPPASLVCRYFQAKKLGHDLNFVVL